MKNLKIALAVLVGALAAGCVPFGVWEKHSENAKPEMQRVCRGYFPSLLNACSSPLLWKEG